jgi:hypothetical protein
MKRFWAWLRRPQLHIQFVEPGKDTNPLAEQAIDAMKGTLATLHRSLALVYELQVQLARVREELTAYAASSMEPDAQVAELKRLREREAPQKNV